MSTGVVRRIQTILAAKAGRTPAQRKVSSQLLEARRVTAEMHRLAERVRQQSRGAQALEEMVTVDIRADVTPEVLDRIQTLGGSVIDSLPRYRAVRAGLPLGAIETLAELDAVQSIRRADVAVTNAQLEQPPFDVPIDAGEGPLTDGPVTRNAATTQGDVAHRANSARTTHDVDGTGIGIGVLSDGVRTLADRQGSGDLPARVTVLSGQKGGPLSIVGLLTGKGGDEGTAMLEIVHDLAPGAALYFATGRGGEARMAENIEALCEAGADVIVDDIFYFREPAFQDGVIAKAVNEVVSDGCFYFSAAGNAGNLNDGTAGVWEGDYVEGTDFEVSGSSVGKAHDFGSSVEANKVTKDGLSFVLQWADPLGASANDYDLFLVDADDNVLASSTDVQDGTQDPIETIDSSGADYTDSYLVVVKASGAANRYLRLDTIRGQLEVATAGQTSGHKAAENAVTVGAVDVSTAAGSGGVFNGTESVRTDSSDGPRRMFFEPDGTPVTAGNFSSTGGELLQKPDLVAATCVSTSAPEFSKFCGTSSAAPHAGAIAALMLEAAGGPDNVTLSSLRTGMTGASLDIEASGVDRDSGAGIVMAPGAVDAVDVAATDRNGVPTVEGTLTVQTLAPGGSAATVDVSNAFDDPDDDTLSYTALSSDTDTVTAGINGSTLTLTPLAPGRIAVTVRAVDPEGLSVTRNVMVTIQAGTRDYDSDNDGYIEISNLTQFNAMRYDQNGDGAVDRVGDWMSYYAASAFTEGALGMGCPDGCVGYELEEDLDFDTNGSGDADSGDDYWDDGAGWFPFPVRFNLKGNGHAIANLFINRPTQAGSIALFGNVWTPEAGETVGVSGIRLVDVDVTGKLNVGGLSGTLSSSGFITGSSVTGRVKGTERVGGLVGHNRGAITASRASGRVSGTTSVGGLVGHNQESITGSYATGEVTGETAIGGLVGLNWDSIETSYSTSQVTGEEQVGGLVGRNAPFSSIVASYGTGRVSGTTRVGGLAGDNLESIAASYSTGPVSGETLVGGLTGFVNGSVTASYWDKTTSGQAASAGGTGGTTAALETPTSTSGIYGTWSSDDWHFGTNAQYPALEVDLDGNGEATWQEFGYQLREGPTLTATTRPTHLRLDWTAVEVNHWSTPPVITYTVYREEDSALDAVAENLTGLSYTDTDVTVGETYTYQVAAVVTGGEATRSARFTVEMVVDATAPTVSNLEITSNPGTDRTYAAGDEIRVTATFSETVRVTGAPQLSLEIGGGRRMATYGGGSGTMALVFAYEVADGDSDTSGVGVEEDGLSLNGGTIKDASDNPAVLDHDELAGNSSHKVDGVKPELAATGGVVVNGTTMTLTYDEPLDRNSTPDVGDFTVSGGDQTRTVLRISVSGSTVTLTLNAGAGHGEAGVELSYTPGMEAKRLRDVPGNQAEALSREPVRNDTPDTTPPEVSSLAITSNPGSDQTYAIGEEIQVTMTFSETVKVTGRPRLTLRVENRNRPAGYLRGTDTEELVFGYEVVEGDEDGNGVSIRAGRIALNGGTIKDEAENAAELAHEALAAQAGHQVDGVRPAFVSAAVDGASLTLTYEETLDGGSEPGSGDFTVTVGGSERTVLDASVSASVATLTLNPEVEHGDTGIRVSYTPGANPIRDEVGNDAQGLNNRSVTNTTGAPNTDPEITSPGSFDVPENQIVVRRLAARDTDPGDEVTGWEIVGGADQSQFEITPQTGELSFREAPDYEDPADLAGTDPVSGAGDNQYVVRLEVKSGAGARELDAGQTLTVSVTDEREPPEVPEAPVISGETADSLTVSWSEPDNTGPDINDYDVRYREKEGGPVTVMNHPAPGLSLTLADLEPGTVYEVQVQARNDEGTSDWSEPGEGMTIALLTLDMTAMEEPPVSGPFTVRFSFSEPATGFIGSDVDSERDPECMDDQNNPVFCDPVIGGLQTADNRIFTTTVTPQTDHVAHSYALTLTVPGGRVSSSVGSKLNEEPEEPLTVRVSPPGAPEPISTLSPSARAGNGSVRLSWIRPTDNGGSAIIRYEYRFAPAGEAWSEWENVGAGARGVTVGNLINGRDYVFELRAVSALGKGSVETVEAAPVAGGGGFGGGGGGGGGGLLFPPEAPATLTALPGDGGVRLQWSPPENGGGSPIQRYEYRLKEGRGEFGEWTPIPDSGADEVNASGYTVMALDNGTVYVFELRAVNAAGNGQESESVEVTMPLDPAYWSNFRAEDLEGTQLMLEAFLLEGSSRNRQLRFGEGLRFEEDELDGEGEVTATHSGSYGYRYTSRTTGVLSLDFDGGEACEMRLTFSGEGAGSYSYRCGGSSRGQGSFRMSELVNRVPEITSTGPFEVEENTTEVGQLQAVEWDEEDEVTGYGIAGGADGALFTVEALTGELSFTEAPDYENPGDVESTEPQSEAGDNEYILVVEVTSGEGERERSREQAIRVRVTDVEMEEAIEEETESLFVPVILSSAGRNNSFFTSELTLTNRGEEEVKLNYTYSSRDEPDKRSGEATDVLPAGSQTIAIDAFNYLRNVGVPIPETGNQLGTLRVEAPPGSEVEAVVRTTTVVPDGRAGLAYPGVSAEEGFREPVYLCGLRQNSQDRSNVAFQNMGAPKEGAITLRTTVYSGESSDTSPRELDDITLEPGGFHQYNRVLNVLGSDAGGYVKVERVEGTAPFYAYGVVNDQANSDGSFIFPVTAGSLEGKMAQTLPVIVETRDFTSELTVTNFSQEPRTLNFQFVAEGIDTDDRTAAFSMTLEAGQQEIVAEVVEALRSEEVAGLGTGRRTLAGPVFVTAEEGDLSGIVVGARTGSKGGGGQYSVFYNAVPEGEAFTRVAWVDGLQQNEENRSNLALVNTGEVDESESVFHLEIYDGETGMLVETVVTKAIPARHWHQINGILGRASPETRQGYIRIEKVSGENPFLAYGVVNDGGAPGQRSGDGAYLPARE